ncbi:MAG: tetratricopeptide repeat protein [Thermoguttaceae bacterium]
MMHGRLTRREPVSLAPAAGKRESPERAGKLLLALLVGLSGVAVWGCANLRGPAGGMSIPTDTADPTAALLTNAGPDPKQASRSTPSLDGRSPGALRGGQSDPLENQIAMARLCERRGESDDAEQLYRALLQKAPRDPLIHHRLGVLAVAKGSFSEAQEHFRTAMSHCVPGADLLSDVGYCCYLQGRFQEAEDWFHQALKVNPNYRMAINNLGLAVGAQGRFNESLSLFKRIVSEAEAYSNVGYVLAENGQPKQAQQMWLRALSLDNTLRPTAQAMLQVAERSQTQVQTSAAGRESPPAAAVGTGRVLPTAMAADQPDRRLEATSPGVQPSAAQTELAAGGREPLPLNPTANQPDRYPDRLMPLPLPGAAGPQIEKPQVAERPLEARPLLPATKETPSEGPPAALQAVETQPRPAGPPAAIQTMAAPPLVPPPAVQTMETPDQTPPAAPETPEAPRKALPAAIQTMVAPPLVPLPASAMPETPREARPPTSQTVEETTQETTPPRPERIEAPWEAPSPASETTVVSPDEHAP